MERLGFTQRDLWWAVHARLNPEHVARGIASDAFEADPYLDEVRFHHTSGDPVPGIWFQGSWDGSVERRESGVYDGPASVFAEELVGIADLLVDTFENGDLVITREEMKAEARAEFLSPHEAMALAARAKLSTAGEASEDYRDGFREGAEFIMEVLLPDVSVGTLRAKD
jgi:hypothetical protein